MKNTVVLRLINLIIGLSKNELDTIRGKCTLAFKALVQGCQCRYNQGACMRVYQNYELGRQGV
jgi:hypothetical protein